MYHCNWFRRCGFVLVEPTAIDLAEQTIEGAWNLPART